jgi:hypothetical protein
VAGVESAPDPLVVKPYCSPLADLETIRLAAPSDSELPQDHGKSWLSDIPGDDVPESTASLALRADFCESTAHPGQVVEVGFIPNFVPIEFALEFEGFPLWLLALERSFCKRLHIMGWESAGALKAGLEDLGTQVKLTHRALTHLGIGRVM